MLRVHVRPASEADLGAIARIQAAAPTASQWEPAGYLAYECCVAVVEDEVVGFVVSRTVFGETEILNVAVAAEFRRRGLGRALMADLLGRRSGAFFLEVRESNVPAQRFYNSLGFRVAGNRRGYYHSPPEPAVVMILHSC
jgi:ribosomal-protein-alanine acetyltransferase